MVIIIFMVIDSSYLKAGIFAKQVLVEITVKIKEIGIIIPLKNVRFHGVFNLARIM